MDEATPPILKVEHLKKYFPVQRGFLKRKQEFIRAVDGIDLQIWPRKTLGLVGESGCGKSTVARLILRLLTPDHGRIWFESQDISALKEREFKPLRKQIQMIFQDPYSSLNPRMTVAQTIAEGVHIAGITSRVTQRQRIERLLEMVGMPKASAGRYPHEFSGGQRQRVGIARALSVSPRLILCDEPISALDVSIQAQIINLLKDLQDELGLSYLFISHDLSVVSYICDHVCVMYRGQILESAPADELFDNPRHPYTLKLLSAAPTAEGGDRIGMNFITQVAPGANQSPCVFAPQCPEFGAACETEPTVLREVAPAHFVRCRIK